MPVEFADLLRRLRLDAGLSQEVLAERAGISVDAVGGYERGLRHAPRRETIALLVDALQLGGEERARFEDVARRKRGAATSSTIESAHNLPWQRTSFVGREREVGEITALLERHRLVTITGTGGIGKTRTSIEVASLLPKRPIDGIWFVDLAPIADEAFVVSKLAATLDLRLPESDDPMAPLTSAVGGRELLLILDNCEHVLGAVRAIASAMLDACPRVTVLATSRERLAVAGECTYQFPTLAMPAALELLSQRASSANVQFTDEHLEAATDVCRRLDGIALAIELAAARLPVLGLVGLRSQLATQFRVLSGGPRDLPVRQQTLHAAIAWSHDLLDDSERVLFRRLAVFAGGWTLDAAQTVCADRSLECSTVLDALLSLTEKSLVAVDLDSATPRYSFFESTRAFALEQLVTSEEGPDLARKHAEWMAAFADRAYDLYLVTPRWRWEIEVGPELDDALAALEWAFGPDGDVVLGGRIASCLYGFWIVGGQASYGGRFVNEAVERIDAVEHPALMARLLVAQAAQLLHGNANADAMEYAIVLLDGGTDRRTLARCYNSLAHALMQTGNYAQAEAASDRAAEILNAEGLQRSALYARYLSDRSRMFRLQGRLDEAKLTLTESLALAKALADDWTISLCHMILAEIEFANGDARRAVAIGEEALESARRVRQELYALCNLACFQLALGKLDAAESNARATIALARGYDPNGVQAALQHLAAIASLRGEPLRAARVLGYVNAWYDRAGYARDATDQRSFDMLMTSLREQLSDIEIAALAAQGALFSEESAIEEAAP